MSAMEKPIETQPLHPVLTLDVAVHALGDLTTASEITDSFNIEPSEISGLVYAQAHDPITQRPLRVYPMAQFEIIGSDPRVSKSVSDLWLNTVLPEVAEGQGVNGIVLFMSRRDIGLGGRSIIDLVREERRFRGGADAARETLATELARNR